MNIQSKSEELEKSSKGGRQLQSQEQSRRLVETALRLFSQRGYDATSIKAIATAAGVAVGLLYHYFPSKEALLGEILETHSFLPELRALLLVEHDLPTERVLLDVARGFASLIEDKDEIFRLMVRESQSNAAIAATLSQTVQEGIATLSAFLQTRVQVGELRPHDTTLTARALLATVFTTHLMRLPKPDWESLVAQTLDGVRAQN